MLTKTPLAVSTPEAQGIASEAILAFLDAVEQAGQELHSVILLRHGQTIAKGWWSPYAAELPHMLFSLSKSFTSTAVGMAVAEGLLTVKDRVVDFFPDDLPEKIDDNLARMDVHSLLSMSTGHDKDVTDYLWQQPEGNWPKGFLSRPVEHEPGTHFTYNSGATYMLSAIVQKLTGQTLVQYLTPRLFAPLGIEGATWQSCPRGVNTGGWGLNIKTEDIARFGQLYLQQGQWEGQQLITPEWVAAATSKQVSNDQNTLTTNPDWQQGYGYQFWRCRNNAYRGDGAFGQYCVVMPDQDAVLAITSGLGDMQPVLTFAWEHLLPAMKDGPLPANPSAQSALADRLETLALRVQRGNRTSPLANLVSGKRYTFDKNEDGVSAVKLDFDENGAHITLTDGRGDHQLPCGFQKWAAGKSLLDQTPHESKLRRTAASGAWTADDTYTVRVSFNETPFIPVLSFRFVEGGMEYRKRYNVGFGPPEGLESPVLVGKAA